MKSIKDLREDYNLITEKEEHDMNKLTQLVRAGLFDAKKLSALKRAMEKPADKMTAQEKRMLINLLDALMSEVLSDKQVYRKIKQDVMMKEAKDNFVSDPRFGRGYPSQKDVPSVLLLKRKAIRVFPDGQKVALYYAQAIDKYVSIPFSEIGINEEVELNEAAPLVPLALAAGRVAAPIVGRALVSGGRAVASKGKEWGKKALDAWRKSRADRAAAKAGKQKRGSGPRTRGSKKDRASSGGRLAAGAAALSSALGSGSSGSSNEPKYFTPMNPKLQATAVAPTRTTGADSRAERERQASLRASKAMTQNESVDLDGNVFELNNKAASKVKTLYESLNKKNKKKMVDMMKESNDSLQKVIAFAVRQ